MNFPTNFFGNYPSEGNVAFVDPEESKFDGFAQSDPMNKKDFQRSVSLFREAENHADYAEGRCINRALDVVEHATHPRRYLET